MSQENVEVVRRLFDAARSRDAETVLALYDSDVEWDGTQSRWAEVMPGDARWRGRAELRSFFRAFHEMWDSLDQELEEVIDAGDHVVAVVTTRGRAATSGIEVEWPHHIGVWTIREGKVIRVVWFRSRAEALEAVGLRE